MHVMKLFLGIILSSVGLMFIILYLNLLTMGYSFLEYVHFISTRIECLLLIFGLLLLFFSLKGWIKNVLLLRRTSKFSR